MVRYVFRSDAGDEYKSEDRMSEVRLAKFILDRERAVLVIRVGRDLIEKANLAQIA
jgi:hypothetical protein